MGDEAPPPLPPRAMTRNRDTISLPNNVRVVPDPPAEETPKPAANPPADATPKPAAPVEPVSPPPATPSTPASALTTPTDTEAAAKPKPTPTTTVPEGPPPTDAPRTPVAAAADPPTPGPSEPRNMARSPSQTVLGEDVIIEVLLPSGQSVSVTISVGEDARRLKAVLFERVRTGNYKKLKEDGAYLLKIGSRIIDEADEGTKLRDIIQAAGGKKVRATKMFLVDRDAAKADKNKVVSIEIGALVGRPLSLHDLRGNDEINVFREAMIPVIKDEMRSRKAGEYIFAPHVSSQPLPSSIVEKLSQGLLVRFHFANTAQHKTMKWDLLKTPDQTLADIFGPQRKVLKDVVPDDAVATDYLLKAYGSADFFVGDNILASFTAVRKNLLRHSEVHVSLISREAAVALSQADVEDDEEDPLGPETSLLRQYDHTDLKFSNTLPVDRLNDPARVTSMWDLTRKFKLRITGVDRLSFDPPKKDKKDRKEIPVAALKKAKSKKMNISSVYVVAGIYHGSVPLVPLLSTDLLPMDACPRFHETLQFDLSTCDIPRAARLCFTVFWGQTGEQDVENDTPLAWVNITIVDYLDLLRQGAYSLPMWMYERANPIGTLVLNPDVNSCPALSIEFDRYLTPVAFPNVTPDHVDSIFLPEAKPVDVTRIDYLVDTDPLFKFTPKDRDLLWEYRYYLKEVKKQGLAKLLRALPWNSKRAVNEMHFILQTWADYYNPLDSLELLDADFPDSRVRSYAVRQLERMDDDEIVDFMIQLVQALKYEAYLDNPLARFLIRRSLRSRHVGHWFFWCLKSEMHVQTAAERFGVYLEAYLRGCGSHRHELAKQHKFLARLVDCAIYIKSIPDATREKLQEKLTNVPLPEKVQCTLDQSIEVKGFNIPRCKYMESKKVPLWLVMQNADPHGDDVYMIFKHGDDLRQDMLTLQMIRIMDKLWQQEDMDLHMIPYGAVATGDEVGMIEVVLNSNTLANIQMDYGGGARGAFKEEPLDDWLRQYNPNEAQYKAAVDNFVLSCAGYAVATYVLGIGDRHNDNIMLDQSGHLFHIDFGHFLGNIKRKFGVKRERTPFVFTPDMLFVMGGRSSEQFQRFCDLCVRAYLTLRKHANMFINLFAMMLSTGIPELQCADDIEYLRSVLKLDDTEEVAASFFLKLIDECLAGGWSTQMNWYIHNVVHSSASLKKKI